jgi:hypothetical protein
MLDFEGAAHVAHGDSIEGALRQLGAETRALHVVRDLLTYGPCDPDPAHHVQLRLAHWGVPPDRTGEFSLSATVSGWPSSQPIVVWAAPRAWSDQLFLWWTLDALAREHVDLSRVYRAAPVTYHPLAATGAAPRLELARALAQAQPIAPELVDASRELWRSFASPSPLPFDELRRAGRSAIPGLASIAEPHGWWFPRLIDGRLRLSEMDELLLYAFDDEWRGPSALLRGTRADDITDRLINVYGDWIIVARLMELGQARRPGVPAARRRRMGTARLPNHGCWQPAMRRMYAVCSRGACNLHGRLSDARSCAAIRPRRRRRGMAPRAIYLIHECCDLSGRILATRLRRTDVQGVTQATKRK